MSEIRLAGGEVLRDGRLDAGDLSLAGGRVVERGGRAVDCRGLRVLPGIVDLHGDGFERHLAPRRGALKDVRLGLAATEAELAAHGITTAVLAQFWSWEGGMRSPEAALRLLEGLEGYRGLGTDLRVQLRVETHMRDDWPKVLETVRRFGVGYVVFNDSLPHDRLATGRVPPRLTGKALRAGLSPEALLERMRALHADRDAVQAGLPGFAEALAAAGVRLGSHDDADAAVRARWRGMSVGIAEFPETLEACRDAEAVVMGAPNVVRGNSHEGNVRARDVIAAGLCSALASDYHYPALLQSVFALEADGMEPASAWSLISEGPAAVLGLADRGRLTPGCRADVCVVDPEARRVVGTIAGGAVTHATGRFAAALFSA